MLTRNPALNNRSKGSLSRNVDLLLKCFPSSWLRPSASWGEAASGAGEEPQEAGGRLYRAFRSDRRAAGSDRWTARATRQEGGGASGGAGQVSLARWPITIRYASDGVELIRDCGLSGSRRKRRRRTWRRRRSVSWRLSWVNFRRTWSWSERLEPKPRNTGETWERSWRRWRPSWRTRSTPPPRSRSSGVLFHLHVCSISSICVLQRIYNQKLLWTWNLELNGKKCRHLFYYYRQMITVLLYFLFY